ncbi:hypothetical protein J6T66_00280 [bacterium]|nr:hypothetical protein [bacterium]
MIKHYNKARNNVMSQVKRTEFFARLRAEEVRKKSEDVYEDNPWRKFEKEIGELFSER